MNSREVLRLLNAAGWVQVAQKGSHIQLKHPILQGRVTVPHPKQEVPIGTLGSIEKQSQMKLR